MDIRQILPLPQYLQGEIDPDIIRSSVKLIMDQAFL